MTAEPIALSTAQRGRAAEDAAIAYLRRCGFAILARNVRGSGGELDVIALDGTTVVFVEVKARRSARFGGAVGAVDARKRARIRATAAEWLQVAAPRAIARFDVVAFDAGRIAHHRNAFA